METGKCDTIKVDGSLYDPYYILQVTKDDNDEHIAKAYRKKAKRYHPDKAPIEKIKDYTLKFKIVSEAYNYIKNKRLNANIQKPKDDLLFEFDVRKFNQGFSEDLNPNHFGYGEQKRIQRIEEYDDFNTRIINQFEGKSFDQDEFNKLFDYTKMLQNEQEDDKQKALVHATSDGFYGYNTADTGNCALVHSYNGLMVTGDDFGESGVGYWGDGYSDYKKIYTGGKNPDSIVRVPENFVPQNKEKRVYMKFDDYKKAYDCAIPKALGISSKGQSSSTFNTEREKLCNKTMDELVERERQDETFVKRFVNQYSPDFVAAAINGELERSPSLLENLQEHYNVRRIRD